MSLPAPASQVPGGPPPAAAVPAVTLEDLREAARGLVGVITTTPLVEVGEGAGASTGLHLKCEHLHAIGAFKIRGAHTAIRRLGPERRAAGVVTVSSGNHGQAVAAVARHFGIRCAVVMPESAPAVKVDGVRRYGGEVLFAGAVRGPEQEAHADRLAREEGMVLIPPFDHPDVVAGQGTVGLEILDQLPGVGTIVAPVGGGGLLAGIATAVRACRPGVRVVGAEPDGAPRLSRSLAAGEPVTLDSSRSLADGLLSRRIGAIPWSLLAPQVRHAATVSDEEIAGALRFLYRHQGLRVEPSGAAAVAAVLAGKVSGPGPIVAVLSGGNVDAAVFDRLVGA